MTTDTRADTPPYRDPTVPVEKRVDDLLGRMTPVEKVAQLGSAWVFQLADGTRLSPDRAPALLQDGLGQVTRLSGGTSAGAREAADLANAIQRRLVEETRLGIPAIVHEEVCSGLMAKEATVFPQAIGVAATWEPGLAEALADVVRAHMRALGAHQGLSPVLDVCRDPRWGRTEETFGEDPHLVGRMGVAFIRGLQGDDLRAGVVATAKHFVGYSASEGGLNWAPAHIPPRELREVYLHPFEAAVVDGGMRSIMNGYQELDGIPCGADRELLTTILRDEWGFDGMVVSDYFSVRQLESYHRYAEDDIDAAAVALTAGIDVELPSTDCYGRLLDALEGGQVRPEVFDEAVRRVLRTKFELGLFEYPYVDADRAVAVVGQPEQRQLAWDIARKSMVLLRNDGTLPLRDDVGTVAVIGPNADAARHLFGDYTYPAHMEVFREALDQEENPFGVPIGEGLVAGDASAEAETVVAALRERLGGRPDGRVTFAPGCAVNDPSRDGFDDAVALAAAADVAVLVMGDKSGLTDDCTSGESRDRASLDLPGVQEDLARAVLATGTPVVLVLVAGRPCGSARLHEQCAAVLMAWMPGQEGAAAIADVLTGDVAPGGKLPISYPRAAGQIPVFYGHKVSGGRSNWKGDYVDLPVRPLYPFGYGLSYTTFSLTDVTVTGDDVLPDGSFTVEVSLTNVGRRAGDEVVQLYVRREQARVTRPVLELKSFARVPLEAGASATLTFEVPAGALGFYVRPGSRSGSRSDARSDDAEEARSPSGPDLVYDVPPGPIDVFVGTSSDDVVKAGTVTVVPDPSGRAPGKVFEGSVQVSRESRAAGHEEDAHPG